MRSRNFDHILLSTSTLLIFVTVNFTLSKLVEFQGDQGDIDEFDKHQEEKQQDKCEWRRNVKGKLI